MTKIILISGFLMMINILASRGDAQDELNGKWKLTGYNFSTADIFPWQNELTGSIDKKTFTIAHLRQPDLFLRLRPGKVNVVKQKLSAAAIGFNIISDSCISLSN